MAITSFLGEKDGGLMFATDTGQQEFLLDTPETRELAGRLGGPDQRTAQLTETLLASAGGPTQSQAMSGSLAQNTGGPSFQESVVPAGMQSWIGSQVSPAQRAPAQAHAAPAGPMSLAEASAQQPLTSDQMAAQAALQAMQDRSAPAAQDPGFQPLPDRPMIRRAGRAGRAAGFARGEGTKAPVIFSSEIQKREAELNERKRDILVDEYLDQKAIIEQEKAALAGQQRANQEEIVAEREQIEELRTRANELTAEVEERRAGLDEERVDPDELWNRTGTFARLIYGMAIAIGEGDQKQGNLTLDQWQLAVDRDIDAQKFNIQQEQQGLTNANNALNAIFQTHGNMQAAESELRGLMNHATQLELGKLKLEQGSPAVNAAFDRAILELDGQKLNLAKRNEAELLDGLRYDLGQSAIAPTVGPMTNQELKDAIERRNLEAEARGEAPMSEDQRRYTTEQVRKYSDALGKSGVPGFMGSVKSYREALHAARDEFGDVEGIGVGGRRKPNWWLSRAGRKVRSAERKLIEDFGRMQSGAVISDEERDEFKELTTGGSWVTEETAEDILEVLVRAAEEKALNISRGYEPGIVDIYNERGQVRSQVVASPGGESGFVPVR